LGIAQVVFNGLRVQILSAFAPSVVTGVLFVFC
jgi:hypothetical protein